MSKVPLIRLTRLRSTTKVSKIFKLEKGVTIKKAAAQMKSGSAEIIELEDFSDFADVLSEGDTYTALCYGLYDRKKFGSPTNFTTAELAKKNPGLLARTKENFAFKKGSGIGFADYDPCEYAEEQYTPEKLINILIAIDPQIDNAAYIIRGSVSSGVHKVGQKPKESSSFHIYFHIADMSDIVRYFEALDDRLWLAGYGHIKLDVSGGMLIRSPLDMAMYQPNRLDFIAPPIIEGKGLKFTPPELICNEGVPIDTLKLKSLSDQEINNLHVLIQKKKNEPGLIAESKELQVNYAEKKYKESLASGKTHEEALKTKESYLLDHDELGPEAILKFDNGEELTVAETLERGEELNNETLADPKAGDDGEKGKAIFYFNSGGLPIVKSFARGGVSYTLLNELKGVVTYEGKSYLELISRPDIWGSVGLLDMCPLNIFMDQTPRRVGVTLKKTIRNLKALLDAYGIYVYYDELLKDQVIVFPDDNNKVNSGLRRNGNLEHLKSLCELNTLPVEAVDRITSLMSMNTKNPIKHMMDLNPWDGFSRLKELSETITLLDSSRNLYKEKALRMWLLQCVAAAHAGVGTPNKEAIPKYETVFVLQGDQGVGKTSWLHSLIPKNYEGYFSGGLQLDLTSKDSKKIAISNWIVELGELGATFRKSAIDDLKNFTSQQKDQLRLPYEKAEDSYPRMTSFCASVNESRFLSDNTGSRRFEILSVKDVNSRHSIDMQQVWAEVKTLYLSGEQWWPDEELKALKKVAAKSHQQVCPIENAVWSKYNLEAKPYSGKVLTATDILIECKLHVDNRNTSRVVAILEEKGFIKDRARVKGVKNAKRGFRLLEWAYDETYDEEPKKGTSSTKSTSKLKKDGAKF